MSSETKRPVNGVDRASAAAAIDAFLRAIGRDPVSEPELAGTGARVAAMFVDELGAGYAVDTRSLVADSAIDVPVEEAGRRSGSLVVVRDVPVVTTCPHHLLPALGTATIAFEARARLVGLGAVAGLAEAHSRRLVLQEAIGEAIVADLEAVLAPAWVACRLVLSHGCMLARGERATGSSVETVAIGGPEAGSARAAILTVLGVGQSR